MFTRDLRLRDHPALAAAARAQQVVPLFVFDREMLANTAHRSSNRFGFLCDALRDLDATLRDRGNPLIVRSGDWVEEVMKVARECDAGTVHVTRDVSRYAQARIGRLQRAGAAVGVEIVLHDTVTVVPPDQFAKPYLVFTPYYRRWIASDWRVPSGAGPRFPVATSLATDPIPDAAPPGPWVGGETAGLARLKAWTPSGLRRYEDARDRPSADATARLSPYLHFGCVSPLEVAARLRDRDGGAAFVRQICWRDFWAQLLWWRPETSVADVRAGLARGRDDAGDLAAWKEGRTGYPLVDAGMRQLLGEGWMHNRVRMVVASFLTKDLGLDWRLGAAHFMDLLVDGDVASNQLSWQWVAGTGTDTNPHRVLNPTVQATRHDPDGTYVRRWIPELGTAGYPDPIVDHKEAIAAWRESRRG